MKRYYFAMAILVVAAAAAIGVNYTFTRPIAEDQKRTDDLVTLQTTINNYFNNNNSLPTGLDQLQLSSPLSSHLNDYQYKTLGTAAYEVCATFQTNTQINQPDDDIADNPYNHDKGYQCFKVSLDRPGDKPLPTHPEIRIN
jgi:hypothetical protein